MCPIRAGGSVAIAGENGAGTTVVMEEIVRRISKGSHPVTLFVLIPRPPKSGRHRWMKTTPSPRN